LPGGAASPAIRRTYSPCTPSGCWLVARTATPGACASSSVASSAAASSTCSQCRDEQQRQRLQRLRQRLGRHALLPAGVSAGGRRSRTAAAVRAIRPARQPPCRRRTFVPSQPPRPPWQAPAGSCPRRRFRPP
jgi:hypothetical protein